MKNLNLILFFLISFSFAQNPPKNEFRASWVATAYALDFPLSNWSTSAMQLEIVLMLDSLKHNGFNAVIFQVRPGCDAFYNSSYEPWSHHLTGTSGAPPSPYFDPLETWITEAHARNMELHAWFNPFRVTTSSNPSSLHSSHVYHQHPEWLLTTVNREHSYNPEMFSNTLSTDRDLRASLLIDPGKAEVRDYIINVFMDVVNNYDVDGVHMDDYFYPYGGMGGEDGATFAAEPRGFTDIEFWRRDNINSLVQGIHDSIQVVKPWVKYGVSPFGIWKSGFPSGIEGTSSYYELYCDPMAWLNAGSIDYLTPQLYWEHGGGQDYASLMPWWADSVLTHNRHLYVGHAPYRMTDFHNWPASEPPRQIRLNRITDGCQGSVHFRLRDKMVNNPKGFLDSLDNDYYLHPALIPAMPWKDDILPNAPQSVMLVSGTGMELHWTAPDVAEDGDTAYKYVVYTSDEAPVDVSKAENILRIVSSSTNSISVEANQNFYAVATLDRLWNESAAVMAASSGMAETVQPKRALLVDCYPNPFNPSTIVRYDLEQGGSVDLTIHDISGRLITALVEKDQPRGSYQSIWNGSDSSGRRLGAGVYICRLKVNGQSSSIKLVLLK